MLEVKVSNEEEQEETFNLLDHMEHHLATTSKRLWEDRAAAMTKQLKKWGVDKEHITEEPPYVYVDGYRFQYFEGEYGDDNYEIKKGKKSPRIASSFQGVLNIIIEMEGRDE